MDIKHTPGPWEHEPMIEGAAYFDIYSKSGDVIAETVDGVDNARLMAAAPELLKELKRLTRAYVSLMEGGRDRIIDLGGQCDPLDVMEAGDPFLRDAKAAIAKAEAA